MAGYYDETTGEYITETDDTYTGGGGGFGELDDTSGTNTMEGWGFSDGVWSDPSGKTYNMRYLTPNEQLSLGGQLSKLGQIAAQKLAHFKRRGKLR